MAFRVAATANLTQARQIGFRGLFSTLSSSPGFPFGANTTSTAPDDKRPQAEPSTNLFISGLNKRTTSEALHAKASEFGAVVHARVVTDRVNGYSKGFGFVRYASIEDAAKGIVGMDGKFLDGWVIFAEYARPREAAQPGQYERNY
jgi:RNA recognition motif-containing protein